MTNILKKILFSLSQSVLKKYRPKIIAITGSTGKTSTKEAAWTVLHKNFSVRKSSGNYNNEIGVPLTILGIPHYGKNIFFWFFAFVEIYFKSILGKIEYPKILILEMGADHPGDILYLTQLAKPHISIITAIGEIPVHVEFFKNPEELANEKGKIIEALSKDGIAILNGDDERVKKISKKTKAKIYTFGFDEKNDLSISGFKLHTEQKTPKGSQFVFEYKKERVLITLQNSFGKPQAYAAAGAALLGIHLGISLKDIGRALEIYSPPPGRLRLLPGIKHSYILDDTYNSSPSALEAAFETLLNLPAKRKIAVLGDMLELGDYSEETHRKAGSDIKHIADVVVTVGARAKFIAEEARENIEVFSFNTAEEAAKKLDPVIEEGDLVLIKGSQGIRMEKIVEEIMAEPEKAEKLLVRQNEYWKNKK